MGVTVPALVYALCFATSTACALLLGRTWLRTRARLLLWSTLCFVFLTANNLFLIIDLLLVPQIDFQVVRLVLSLTAVGVLLYGFVWNSGEEA